MVCVNLRNLWMNSSYRAIGYALITNELRCGHRSWWRSIRRRELIDKLRMAQKLPHQ
jgi:hypothetical protein